jgi:hypothetical protein
MIKIEEPTDLSANRLGRYHPIMLGLYVFNKYDAITNEEFTVLVDGSMNQDDREFLQMISWKHNNQWCYEPDSTFMLHTND